MNKLSPQQRMALKMVYNRSPVYGPGNRSYSKDPDAVAKSYLTFRRSATLTRECLVVPWCGMFLAIEADGYTHS